MQSRKFSISVLEYNLLYRPQTGLPEDSVTNYKINLAMALVGNSICVGLSLKTVLEEACFKKGILSKQRQRKTQRKAYWQKEQNKNGLMENHNKKKLWGKRARMHEIVYELVLWGRDRFQTDL